MDNGVVGGVHVRVEWKCTFTQAVKSFVSLRRDDPILIKERKRQFACSLLLSLLRTTLSDGGDYQGFGSGKALPIW